MTDLNSHGEPAQTPVPKVKSPDRWVRVALAVSLAINLGIAGIVAGVMMRNGGPMHDAAMTRDLGFGPFTEALSKEDRSDLRRAFLAKVPELRDGRRAMRKDFGLLLTQLREVPLDQAGLRAAFDRQNTRNTERLGLGQQLIFDLVVGMTDAERQAFAERLEQSLAKGPKRQNDAVQP
jgi:uncharacterized membrane protein